MIPEKALMLFISLLQVEFLLHTLSICFSECSVLFSGSEIKKDSCLESDFFIPCKSWKLPFARRPMLR